MHNRPSTPELVTMASDSPSEVTTPEVDSPAPKLDAAQSPNSRCAVTARGRAVTPNRRRAVIGGQ